MKQKMQNTLRFVGSVCMFLSTSGIQCLVADCPQVLGSSVWSNSGTKQHCGMRGDGSPLTVQL